MDRIPITRLALAALLSASALACDGTVEPPHEESSPSTDLDAAVPSGPLTPVITPMPDGGSRTSPRGGADGGASDDDRAPGDGEGNAASDGVPLFVAVGEVGRTLVSCDDGRSWVADASDSSAPCSGNACDHSTSVPTGLAYAEGRWFSARGWGYDGPVSWTEDGETWTDAPLTGRWNGLAAAPGLLFIQGTPNKASVSRGAAFEDRPYVSLRGHVRGDVYILDGKLWLISDMGDVRTSTDQGRTWSTPREVEARCLRDTQPHQGGLAYDGKGVLVFVNSSGGVVCRSTDHGATFRFAAELGASATTPLVYAAEQFWVWTGNRLRRSRDGTRWSDERTNARSLMPVARSDDGTWVGADGVYQDQQMLRSSDGITWEVLPGARFEPGHRIRRIVFGRGKKPPACD